MSAAFQTSAVSLRVSCGDLQRIILFLGIVSSCPACVGSGSPASQNERSAGDDGDQGEGASHGGSGQVGGNVPAASCNTTTPGDAPLRRLSRFELNNTLRDLLGDSTKPADKLPPEELGNGFGNDANALGATRTLIDGYTVLAEQVALRATSDANKIKTLTGCSPSKPADEANCVSGFVKAFGERAFRHPVDDDDAAAFLSLFRALRAAESFDAAVRGVLQAMLESPHFLYRVEFGTPEKPAKPYLAVTGHEMATRLSYMLWGTLPDEALTKAARDGQLQTKAQIQSQAQRMLKDSRARELVGYFHGVLFALAGAEQLEKNAKEFPAWAGMAPLLKEESQRFLDFVVWDGPRDLKTLLSADFSFMNAKVAAYYGIIGPAGSGFEKVALPPQKRAGLLTQAIMLGLLTPGVHSNPTTRGAFVLERLLCTPPPSPPSGLNVTEPTYTPDLTTRERFAEHTRNPACAGCHRQMDPIGFAFESFDSSGQWRDKDNGKNVNTAAMIEGDVDIAGPNQGAVELVRKLGTSAQVSACFVRHWFSYAHGRNETPADACAKQQLEQVFAKGGHNVRGLLLALTQTDAFLFRPQTTP